MVIIFNMYSVNNRWIFNMFYIWSTNKIWSFGSSSGTYYSVVQFLFIWSSGFGLMYLSQYSRWKTGLQLLSLYLYCIISLKKSKFIFLSSLLVHSLHFLSIVPHLHHLQIKKEKILVNDLCHFNTKIESFT